MKDDKPAVKKVPRDVEVMPKWDEGIFVETPVAEPEPAPDAPLPVGTHADNVKKDRRPGKPQ